MLYVRPLNKKDILDSYSKEIKSIITKGRSDNILDSNYDVLSKTPYNSIIDDDLVDTIQYTKRTHISLATPILNVILAGNNSDVIRKLFNDSIPIHDIVKGSCVVELLNDGGYKFLKADSIKDTIYNNEKHLIGGEAVLFLLGTIDICNQIAEYLLLCINKVIDYNLRKNLPNKSIGYINKSNNDKCIWVLEDYFLHSYIEGQEEYLNEVCEEVRKSIFISESGKGILLPIITVLLSFERNPKVFYDMVQDFIPILPYGFRPSIGDRKHPLSELFNRVVRTNNVLKSSILTPNCKLNFVRQNYSAMYRTYIDLILVRNKYDAKNYKSIKEMLVGKTAIIREDVQGTVIDNAGRTVITVDPFMSVDSIGIPKEMAFNLCEYKAIKEFKSSEINKVKCLNRSNKELMQSIAQNILNKSYILAGRQPTLHLLGLQGFKAVSVEGSSIKINPLVTTAYNADFDGDQMWVQLPQSEEAQKEASTIVANINNAFLPRDGSCHMYPKMEMVYGLFKCYNASSDSCSRTYMFESESLFRYEILDKLSSQEIFITDKCIVNGKKYDTIGKACLDIYLIKNDIRSFIMGVVPLSKNKNIKEKCVGEKFYKEILKYVHMQYGPDMFVKIANNLVRLGFTVSNLYHVDISVIKSVNTSDIKEEFDTFISKRQDFYNLGFDTEESYTLFYSDAYNKLEEKVIKRIKETLGEDNGFVQLISSGARGSKSNLLQLFGMKGIILKNKNEVFNVVIKNSLNDGLTGLEHFITAYGSREGIIEKVVGTYAPGYLSRKMSHITRHTNIVSKDCGTTNGILISYDFMCKMYGIDNLSNDNFLDYITIKKYTCNILATRYIVGGPDRCLSYKDAEEIFDSKIAKFDTTTAVILKYSGVKMRSPITCEDPCCVKCYGVNLLTNKECIVGAPVGYLAYSSIGEPVTQLSMKNFQKGGVAGNKNITSAIDMISDIFEMYPASKIDSKNEAITHDYISPVEGKIKVNPRGDGTSKLLIINDDGINKLRETVYIYDNVELKNNIKVGESIQKYEGILDINEILRYRGVEDAQMHMMFSVYNLFVDEVFVNIKHFEILIAGMTLYLCYKSNGSFRTGNYYSIKEYMEGDKEDALFYKVIRGIKQVPKVKNDFLTSIYSEDLGSVIQRNIVTSGYDSLTDPFVRVTLGLKPELGTYYPDYINSRGV